MAVGGPVQRAKMLHGVRAPGPPDPPMPPYGFPSDGRATEEQAKALGYASVADWYVKTSVQGRTGALSAEARAALERDSEAAVARADQPVGRRARDAVERERRAARVARRHASAPRSSVLC